MKSDTNELSKFFTQEHKIENKKQIF